MFPRASLGVRTAGPRDWISTAMLGRGVRWVWEGDTWGPAPMASMLYYEAVEFPPIIGEFAFRAAIVPDRTKNNTR
jgi:hypothetical protein